MSSSQTPTQTSIPPVPRRVDPLSPTELLIGWSNGEEYALPYAELRFHCPCAACIDEHTGRRTIQRSSVNPDVRPLSVEPVGRYALQFRWSDGHATGMYHFDRLLECCRALGRTLRRDGDG